MLMLPGTPFVYYGEELGMIGDKPDEQIRTPMQWSAEPNGAFSASTPWEALQPDWRSKNVAGQDGYDGSLLNYYRRLIHFRNAHLALSRGQMVIGSTNDSRTAAFIRRSGAETMLVVVNFGEDAMTSLIVSATDLLPRSLELVYGNPIGCGPARVEAGNVVALTTIPAHGLCVFQVR
jgi:glycosidase